MWSIQFVLISDKWNMHFNVFKWEKRFIESREIRGTVVQYCILINFRQTLIFVSFVFDCEFYSSHLKKLIPTNSDGARVPLAFSFFNLSECYLLQSLKVDLKIYIYLPILYNKLYFHSLLTHFTRDHSDKD